MIVAVKKKKVLIVEDEPPIAEFLEVLLNLSGYDTRIARDGRAGIETAREFFPDLILLDILLPKVSGFDVCKILREDAAFKNTIIIMLTALTQLGDTEKAFSLGATDYLGKPIDSDRLLQKIRKHLGE
jgi:two-component system, OmpR family, alkaline phosphatase synthesis response regulator PhoP